MIENIKLQINHIKYVPLGRYMDNNDGIFYYFPESDDINDWRKQLENESTIIKLWIIGNMNYEQVENNLDILFPKKVVENIHLYQSNLKQFVKKYFIDDGIVLNKDFEDFVFGRFSDYGCNYDFFENETTTLKDSITFTLRFEDELVKLTFNLINNWEFSDYVGAVDCMVYIKEELYQILLFDLNNIFNKLFK